MKYIVEVNAKYMVNIEAESCIHAEHIMLEYKGIWGALAYDRKALKTDTFAGAVQFDEFVSMNEMIEIIGEAASAKEIADKAIEAEKAANDKVAELEAMLLAAKEAAREASRAKADALYKYEKAEDKLGKRN